MGISDYLNIAKWVGLVVLVLYGWHSFQSWRAEERKAAQTQLANQINVATLQSQLDRTQADLKAEQARSSTLNQQLDTERSAAQQRTKIFNEHQLDKLVQAKPGLVEQRINAATAKVWEQIEQESRQ